jgi:hypothetical protein
MVIEVRKGEDGDARLTLVVAPPEKRDACVDPSLAVERLFSILARGATARTCRRSIDPIEP